MLNDIYQEVKSALQAITGSYPAEWFNMQYEGVMINENGFFVEFPDALLFDKLSKDTRRTPIKIRVHVYSKVVSTADGIPDTAVEAHEVIALDVLDALDRQELISSITSQVLCTRLQFRGWQHWHKWKGWMVTYIDFEAKKNF